MELTHQLTPMLRTLRLSGILGTLGSAIVKRSSSRPPSWSSSPSCCRMKSNAAPRASSGCGCAGAPSIHQDPRGLRLQLQSQAQQGPGF